MARKKETSCNVIDRQYVIVGVVWSTTSSQDCMWATKIKRKKIGTYPMSCEGETQAGVPAISMPQTQLTETLQL